MGFGNTTCCSRFDDPTHHRRLELSGWSCFMVSTAISSAYWLVENGIPLMDYDMLQYIGWYNPKLIINQQGCLARKTIHLSMGTSLQNFSHHFFNTSRELESDKWSTFKFRPHLLAMVNCLLWNMAHQDTIAISADLPIKDGGSPSGNLT